MKIHAGTFIGVATNQPLGARKLVEAVDAGAVTFIYATGNKVKTMAAGEIVSVEGACTGVTSTALQNIIIS